jgi:alkaline phosphatase
LSRKYKALVLLALSLSVSLMPLGTASESSAKNVILLIGDGMGFPQLTAARIEKADNNLTNYTDTELYMDSMKQTGYVTTFSANSFVTDSAPAATSMATGQKTNNGVISQDATAHKGKDGKNLTTILEMAEAANKSTGVVTTTRITHATPAAFYAHVDNRDNESEIADQLLASNVEVIMGGGLRFFVGKNETDPLGGKSKRDDNRNLLVEFGDKGYAVVYNDSALMALDANFSDKVLGLFDNDHVKYDLEREGSGEPSVAEMTTKALEILSKDKDGFLLMVEGGRIDHASHARNLSNTIGDTLAFDDAVKVALDFTAKNNDTLVIVTADHECGGFTLQPENLETYEAGGLNPIFASGMITNPGSYNLTAGKEATHTAVDVPIMASGPGAEEVSHGKMDNTEIFVLMKETLGL